MALPDDCGISEKTGSLISWHPVVTRSPHMTVSGSRRCSSLKTWVDSWEPRWVVSEEVSMTLNWESRSGSRYMSTRSRVNRSVPSRCGTCQPPNPLSTMAAAELFPMLTSRSPVNSQGSPALAESGSFRGNEPSRFVMAVNGPPPFPVIRYL